MSIPILFWLAAVIIFLIIEASCPCLLSIWFAAGSLAAIAASALGASFQIQLLLFALVSGGMLACLRPWLRKYITPHITATNADSLIGRQAVVRTAIDNLSAQGQVKVGGMEWTARSADGAPIPEGTRVIIRSIEGVKLIVAPAETETVIL